MIKILFVCHGNICRSPMAEYVFKDMVKTRGLDANFYIDSAATSTEEIGNGVHHGTRRKLKAEGIPCGNHRKLKAEGIPCGNHRAVQMRRSDYEKYDYLIGMDTWNIRNMLRILGEDSQKKVYRLLDFSDSPRDIADPWYTGNFDVTYEDIVEGCRAFLKYLYP